ncbi:MAG: LacI family DNA-binding transcriptional regulator [Coriobacteriales bacterium]|nr:LacI family DNA-binding transcriptional regulator [Coriobacteriales bacterium]
MDINEIARRAGVSRATVSRYLNDGYVSQEKRELIAHIINETGYVPSQQAQQLRTGKSKLVSIVIPKINSQSVSRMVAGITDVLNMAGYQVILANADNDVETEIEFLNLFGPQNRVDGIILIATVLTPEHFEVLGRLSIPCVILGQKFAGHPSVYQDDYHAVYELTRLALRNARQPSYLGVLEEDEAAGRMRRKGFVDACTQAGITPLPQAQLTVGFDADAGYFGAEKLMDTVPGLDTIVCATDDIAFGAMMCVAEYGYDVPKDIQVTGVGDSLLSRIARPSLSTAHLHYRTSGAEAARLLLNRIAGKHSVQEDVKMGYEVYARSSMR